MHIEFFFHWRTDSFFHIINYYNIFAIMYVNTEKNEKFINLSFKKYKKNVFLINKNIRNYYIKIISFPSLLYEILLLYEKLNH